MSDWTLLDVFPNVEVNPDAQVDEGISVRLIPTDPAHRTEIEDTVYPFIEVNYCVTVPQYRQEQEAEGRAEDAYRYAVEEQTVIARTPDDMEYEYDFPSAFDYETIEEAVRERNAQAKRAEDPGYYEWRPWDSEK